MSRVSWVDSCVVELDLDPPGDRTPPPLGVKYFTLVRRLLFPLRVFRHIREMMMITTTI